MGLTIHYELEYPARSLAQARRAVEQLRQRCLDLPFHEVGPMQAFEGKQCDPDAHQKDDGTRWMLIQGAGHLHCVTGPDGQYRTAREGEPWNAWVDVRPTSLVAFSAWPGEGCETANMGLRVLPEGLWMKTRHKTEQWLPTAERDRGWRWQSFCKTQYASNPRYGGVRHFLLCHLTVIAALDAARQLGFGVEVHDEGGFWERRSVEELTRQIGAWDRNMAAFLGAMKDTIGAEGTEIRAPIAERPDFERLEAEGVADPRLASLIRAVQGAAA